MPAAYRSLATKHTSLDTATFDVTKPSGVAEGDILVASWQVAATGPGTNTPGTFPAGWTTLDFTDGPSSHRSRLAWKRAGSSEPASYTFTNPTYDLGFGVNVIGSRTVDIVAISGADPGGSPTLDKFTDATSSNVPSPAASTTLARQGVLLGFWHPGYGTTYTTPSGMTEIDDPGDGGGVAQHAVSYQEFASGGASGTKQIQADNGTTNTWVVYLVTVLGPPSKPRMIVG